MACTASLQLPGRGTLQGVLQSKVERAVPARTHSDNRFLTGLLCLCSRWNPSCFTALKEIHSSCGSGCSSSSPEAEHDLPATGALDAVGDHAAQVHDLGFFRAGAAGLDLLHSATGLPWWAVIPSAAVLIKTLLLPLSLKQAKIVRTNMVLWQESYEFMRQQEKRAEHKAAAAAAAEATVSHAAAAPAALQATAAGQVSAQKSQSGQQEARNLQQEEQQQLSRAAEALHQLHEWQVRLQVFHDLRRKCSVPHPAWFVVNQCLQVM